MKRYQLLYFSSVFLIVFTSRSLFSQNDSSANHRTINISRHKDSTYVKAYTKFYVYHNLPSNALSYKDYILQIQQMKAGKTERLIITDAKPKSNVDAPFDYTSYFQNNHYTKEIKMRPQETDTVRLLVYVSNKGEVKYLDLSPIKKTDTTALVFSKNKKEFKYDVSHLKTENAFKELLTDFWEPAIIKTLKTHPSKRKNKYKTSKGFSEGILTVIYSAEPIND